MMAPRDAEKAYRRAFEDFARWVTEVQSLTANPNPDRDRVNGALLELEKARAMYNHRRDQWAQHLLESSGDGYDRARQDQNEDRLCATRGR
jgi:hypothetical protein